MAEREAEVVAAGATLRLRLLGSACAGCGGCGGRCRLFAADGERELELPAGRVPVVAGQRVRLQLDDEALRRAAWHGYGVALVGLLAGAAIGQGVGRAFGLSPDVPAFVGLVAGTFIAVRFSKPRLPAPVVEPVGSPSSPETTPE